MEMREGESGQRLPMFSSGKLVGMIIVSVFFSELLVMLLLHLFELDMKTAAFVDPVLLTLFLTPIFIFFIYRPINELLEERREYENFRQKAIDQLETKVQERTDELVQKNELLYREINEKKKVEKDLREKKAFLEVVIESLGHPFYVIDAQNYEVKLANRAAGFKDRKPFTKCYELTHNRSTPCTGEDGDPCLLQKVVESGESQIGVHTHFFQDGTKHLVEVHTQPIFDERGKVSSVIEFVIEVASRGKKDNNEVVD